MANLVETIIVPHMRAVSLHNYLEVARFVGVDPLPLMKQAKVSLEDILTPERRIPASSVMKLYDDTAQLSGCESFGLLMAECRSFASLGPISLLLKYQADVREVVTSLIENVKLFNDVSSLSLTDDAGIAIIKFNSMPGFGSRYHKEYAVALMYRVLHEITGGRWQAESVHFHHSQPKVLRVHQRLFGCAIQFNSEFDGIAFPSESLRIANPASDMQLASHAQQYIAMLLAMRPKNSITEHTRHSIYLLLPEGNALLERVAENLAIHPRVLQRLLSRSETSFGDLLNEIRRELARRYLTDSHQSIGHISMLLGYSTMGSFTRWFTGQFGMPPDAWRRADQSNANIARMQKSKKAALSKR